MDDIYRYPKVEQVDWDRYPDYIRIDTDRPDFWYIYQFKYMKLYLEKVLTGWSIVDFFPNIVPENIAIYSNSIFTLAVANDLFRHTEVKIKASDKNVQNWKNIDKNIEVLSLDDYLEEYRRENIKKVVICGIFHENVIVDELMQRGFALNDLVTLCNVLVQ